MAEMKTMKDLLADEIKDLYSAEKQLTKAIPKMAQGATEPELREALVAHLAETEAQVERLEQSASLLGIKPGGKKCKGMEGVIEEGSEALAQKGDSGVVDLGIIGAGSRVEHYEIAGYKSAIALANAIEAEDVAELLQQSLDEEMAAEETLRGVAEGLMSARAAA